MADSSTVKKARKRRFKLPKNSVKTGQTVAKRTGTATEVQGCFSAVEIAGAQTDQGENGKALAEPVLSDTGVERLGNGKRRWPTGDLPWV